MELEPVWKRGMEKKVLQLHLKRSHTGPLVWFMKRQSKKKYVKINLVFYLPDWETWDQEYLEEEDIEKERHLEGDDLREEGDLEGLLQLDHGNDDQDSNEV